MSSIISRLIHSSSFPRGIHPYEGKELSADAAIEVVDTPAEVAVPLLQHTGAPCESVVKPKQEVALGDVLGESQAFISAPVHASISGTVQMPSVATLPNGRHVKTVPIKASPEQLLAGQALWDDIFGGQWDNKAAKNIEPAGIVQAVKQAGVVGQGGAAFPTYVKLTPNDNKSIDTILINGCECEPYLTGDYRIMVEAPKPVIAGALLAARAAGASRIVFAIENNKPRAIASMRQAAVDGIEIKVLSTKYPMGGEKQTIRAALGRTVPTGKLPLDVGVVVINVGTAASIARAVLRGKPLTHRIVTVSGAGITQPRNLLVPIGISYTKLVEACGGLKDDAARVISGGPMMGFAVGDLNVPVTKGTSGLTIFADGDLRRVDETQCVRCGRCVEVCPLNLVPSKLALSARNEDWETARRYHMQACMECACCAYVCPAGIPLAQLIRTGKSRLPK